MTQQNYRLGGESGGVISTNLSKNPNDWYTARLTLSANVILNILQTLVLTSLLSMKVSLDMNTNTVIAINFSIGSV